MSGYGPPRRSGVAPCRAVPAWALPWAGYQIVVTRVRSGRIGLVPLAGVERCVSTNVSVSTPTGWETGARPVILAVAPVRKPRRPAHRRRVLGSPAPAHS